MRSRRGALVQTSGPTGFFHKIARAWSGLKTAGTYSATSFSLLDFENLKKFFGGGSYTGRAVTEDFAMQVSTVWRCVQLISQTIGALPWAVYERTGPNEAREADDHPLTEVLVHSPNADMDRMQLREALTANLVLRGNACALKEVRANGYVSSLYPIPWSEIKVERDRETNEKRFIHMDRGKREVYPSEKIWHPRGFSFNGLVGLEPLGYGRHAIALASAAEEFGARFFANGARVSGVVKIPQWLDDEQRPKAKKNIEELWSGLDNAHKLQLLEGGMEYEEVSAKPGEAQHNELRGFQVPDICRFFGVSPHLAFDLSRATFNNMETLAAEFVMFGLLPHLSRLEISAQKQLLPPQDRRRYFVRFNFEGLLRANSTERAAFYSMMLQNGVYSRNEVREKENLNRVAAPGMDDYTVQTNLALIQFLEAMVKAGAATGRGDPAEDKGTHVNVSMPPLNFAPQLTLPANVRHDVKAAAAPEFGAMVKALEVLTKGQTQLQAELARIAEKAAWPRKPVFDDKGQLKGSVPVREL